MSIKIHRRIVAGVALCLAGAWAWTTTAQTTSATNYQGADAVLRQAAESVNQPKSTDEKPSPTTQLRADLKAFKQQSASLAPAEVVKQWLVLVDRMLQLEETPANYGQRGTLSRPIQPDELVEALPPPACWAELAKAVEARPAGEGAQALQGLGLRLLAHSLLGDTTKRREDIAALEALAAKAKTRQAYFYNSLFEELSSSLMAAMDNPDVVLQTLDRKLAAEQSEEGYRYQSNLQVPDLVPLVGPEKAEAFLRRALVKSTAQLNIDAGTATDKLAQKLALELVNELKTPQWSLVNSLESVDLYEAMEKRFAKPETNEPPAAVSDMPSVPLPTDAFGDNEKQSARIYYLLGLIAHERTADAVAVARQFEKENDAYFPVEVVRQMERAGFVGQLNGFFHELLQQNPDLPFWEEYVQVAAHAGQTAEMVKLVQTAISKPGLSKGQRLHLQQLLYQALLANDEVEAGVTELRRLIQTNEPVSASSVRYERESRGDLALKLAQIGHLLNRPEWQEEGITAAKAAVQKPEEQDYSWWGNNTAPSLAMLLDDLNRGPEAEAVLATALSNAVSKKANPRMYGYEGQRSTPATQILTALVRLYHRAGRDADVLKLFDDAPYWGVKDLADLNSRFANLEEMVPNYSHQHVTVPVGYYAASALAKTGRPAEARKLLDPLFNQSPGCDRLYELLLSLDDEHAPAELDALFARDQFEERPLIWKAHWLRTHQRLAEAEQAARQAIAIDPTDGEEGPGDRIRAYAELAEIRAARGDTNEAETLRSVVLSVHQAELADQFHAAGLLKRAVAMYQDSLNRFADAYCIHARLAVQLSDMGLHEQAEEHYRRAYELMPDSFGRMESYCFGCERAFDGERAQGIAEKVFTELAQKTPNKPQVHYLLGYLREEEERYPEALTNYRVAVRLDPDYLNAWVKIEGISSHVFQSAPERDAVVFNLLRLDPLGRHTRPSFENVSDLAALWHNVAIAAGKCPVKPESLYPLPASKAQVEKQAAQASEQDRDMEMEYRFRSQELEERITPGKAIGQNGFVRAAQELLGNQAANIMDE
jgi:tetratricopeptide (TPR) repeat protein